MSNQKTKKNIGSHFAFGEHWNELPEYAGYVPVYGKNWEALKKQFSASKHFDHERPLRVDIRKGNSFIVVNLHGFKILDLPKVALCKTVTTREYIAIAW